MKQQPGGTTKESAVATSAFAPRVSSVPAARRFVAGHLDDFPRMDVALLIASELATNAVQHAASNFTVEVHRHDAGVRLVVRDDSTAQVFASVPPGHAESGRGLSLVEALSEAWGVQFAPGGKTVWADIRLC